MNACQPSRLCALCTGTCCALAHAMAHCLCAVACHIDCAAATYTTIPRPAHLVRAAFNPGVILSTPNLQVANGQDTVGPGELNEEILATNCACAVNFSEFASCARRACQTSDVWCPLRQHRRSNRYPPRPAKRKAGRGGR